MAERYLDVRGRGRTMTTRERGRTSSISVMPDFSGSDLFGIVFEDEEQAERRDSILSTALRSRAATMRSRLNTISSTVDGKFVSPWISLKNEILQRSRNPRRAEDELALGVYHYIYRHVQWNSVFRILSFSLAVSSQSGQRRNFDILRCHHSFLLPDTSHLWTFFWDVDEQIRVDKISVGYWNRADGTF